MDKESLYDCKFIEGKNDPYGIEFVSFSGGGVLGISFVGVLMELDRRNIRPKIKYWLGSSIGSLVATLGALNISIDFILKHINELNVEIFLDFKKLYDNNYSWFSKLINYQVGLTELVSKLGLSSGENFNNWVKQLLIKANFNPDITFAELYDITGNHLVITTTSLNTFETLYLSRSTYPYMKVRDAIKVSCIFPIIFQPVTMKDPSIPQGKRLLLDGGLLDNLPINACDILKDGEIIGFNRKAIGFVLLDDCKLIPEYIEITGILNYFIKFIECLHKNIQRLQFHQPYFTKRVVTIDSFNMDIFDSDITKEKIIKLIDSGIKSCSSFLNTRKNMIEKYGPLPDNLFIPNYKLRYQGINYLDNSLIQYSQIYSMNNIKF